MTLKFGGFVVRITRPFGTLDLLVSPYGLKVWFLLRQYPTPNKFCLLSGRHPPLETQNDYYATAKRPLPVGLYEGRLAPLWPPPHSIGNGRLLRNDQTSNFMERDCFSCLCYSLGGALEAKSPEAETEVFFRFQRVIST